jgi:hypothetical protein
MFEIREGLAGARPAGDQCLKYVKALQEPALRAINV